MAFGAAAGLRGVVSSREFIRQYALNFQDSKYSRSYRKKHAL